MCASIINKAGSKANSGFSKVRLLFNPLYTNNLLSFKPQSITNLTRTAATTILLTTLNYTNNNGSNNKPHSSPVNIKSNDKVSDNTDCDYEILVGRSGIPKRRLNDSNNNICKDNLAYSLGEDAYFISSDHLFYGIADGVGELINSLMLLSSNISWYRQIAVEPNPGTNTNLINLPSTGLLICYNFYFSCIPKFSNKLGGWLLASCSTLYL
jgi:hypothetical protein